MKIRRIDIENEFENDLEMNSSLDVRKEIIGQILSLKVVFEG